MKSEELDWSAHPSYNPINEEAFDRKYRDSYPVEREKQYKREMEKAVSGFKVTKLSRGGENEHETFVPIMYSKSPKRGYSKEPTQEEITAEWKQKEEKLAKLEFNE